MQHKTKTTYTGKNGTGANDIPTASETINYWDGDWNDRQLRYGAKMAKNRHEDRDQHEAPFMIKVMAFVMNMGPLWVLLVVLIGLRLIGLYGGCNSGGLVGKSECKLPDWMLTENMKENQARINELYGYTDADPERVEVLSTPTLVPLDFVVTMTPGPDFIESGPDVTPDGEVIGIIPGWPTDTPGGE